MVAKGSRTSSQKRAGVRKILKRPAGKFKPFPAPKRGKGRAALKRPAVKKTKAWENVPYTRQPAEVDPTGLRMDRHVWKRSMVDLLKASDKEIINMLLQDGLLTSWEGKLCPRCGEGTLSKAKIDVGGVPKHRCNRFRCQVYINPHHLHPLFTDGNGSGSTSLRIQAALLLLKLNKVSHPVIHRLLGINHKSIELMEKKFCDLRKRWVEHQEKGINFGGGPKWCDVEADETTFDRKDLKALAPDKNLPIVWEQWCGLVKRGDPKSLVLKRLVPRMSEKRAPGPGAIRKVEWAPLAKTYLQDKQVILHTDAAKTYKMHIPGVVHDNVIHAKKRVKINGKWRWQNPSYVRIVTHKVPGVKKPIKCKAGTQIIDRAWKFLKDRLPLNQNCKVGSAALRAKLRSAQYEYWHKNDDLWLATGVLCSWEMVKFQLRP